MTSVTAVGHHLISKVIFI